MMNAKSKTSKAALLTILLSSVFVIGCDRRSADDQAAAESGAAGTSATDTTTAARADTAGSSADMSSSGNSASSGASDSSSSPAASASADTPANTATAPSDTATVSSESSSGASSDQSSGASGDSSGKSGAVVDDSVITTKLKAALLADSEIKGTDVSVDTKQGEVTLTGSVQNKSQKDRIQTIAKGIDGVKNVQDKLTVKQ